MKKDDKTNVMCVLDGKKISYESHSYEPDATMSGEEIAGILGEDPKKVLFTKLQQGLIRYLSVPVRLDFRSSWHRRI